MNTCEPPPSGQSDTLNGNGKRSALSPNLIAIIDVSVSLIVHFIIVGFMCAFRIGWNKGPRIQESQGRKLLSATERGQLATPQPGEPPVGTEMWKVGAAIKVSLGPGRHSPRPGRGVYEISEEQEWSGVGTRSQDRARH